jgi:uncharacterized protein
VGQTLAGVSRPTRDALIAFATAAAAIIVLGLISRGVGIVRANLGALVAIVFIYIPFWYARRHDQDLVDYGFVARPLGKGLAIGLGGVAILFPLFVGGYALFYEVACGGTSELLARLPLPGRCEIWRGFEQIDWPEIDWEFARLAFFQVIVVALPEELFFRGFLLDLLERSMPPKRRIWGGGIGKALVLSSALFALSHVLVAFDPRRLAVFFPGLVFGWMYSATRSILAGVIFHTCANLFIHVLDRMFF